MLKNILNLDGAQQLSKNEQKTINGGITRAQAECIAANECFMSAAACPVGYIKPGCGLPNVCCPEL